MKVALLLGRGIEGTGITRYTTEQYDWLKSNDYYVRVYATDELDWGRSKSHVMEVDQKSNSELPQLYTELDTFDVVFIHSIPSEKNTRECKDKFWEMIRVVSAYKIFVQHDNILKDIDKDVYMWKIVEECTEAYCHSLNNRFAVGCRGFRNIPVTQFNGIGMNFKNLKKYRKPFSEKIRRASYFGRFAVCKKPLWLTHLHPYLSEAGIVTEMRGIEGSIGAYASILWLKDKIIREKDLVDTFDLTKTHIYGPYKREEGLEELSKSLFGCNFYQLSDPTMYGTHLEYASAEIIATGVVPVFSKHWGDNTIHSEWGVKFSDVECAVFVEENKFEESAELMIAIANDEELYEKYVTVATDFFNIFDERCLERVIFNTEAKINLDRG